MQPLHQLAGDEDGRVVAGSGVKKTWQKTEVSLNAGRTRG